MRRVRIAGCFVGLVVCLVTAGCGGGSSSAVTTAAVGGTAMDGSPSVGAGDDRRAIHEPVQSRGIKGEDPRAEAATGARISFSDCMALASLAEERLGTRLRMHSDASPPLSRCRIDGRGAEVNVYLDSGFAAHQRYANRIEETIQFNGEKPAGLPQAVPRVGEKAAYNADANWIPALGSLLALRGNRWLTVTISAPGRSGDELRDEAAVLARAGFRLTAS